MELNENNLTKIFCYPEAVDSKKVTKIFSKLLLLKSLNLKSELFKTISLVIILILLISKGETMNNTDSTIYYVDNFPELTAMKSSWIKPRFLTNFSDIHSTNEKIVASPAKYFIGYNENFLYFYIEIKSDSLMVRDRAYQNGDGLHLMIGEHDDLNSELTDRFYILGFSPTKDWSNKFIWYHNVDLSMKKLSEEVKFEYANDGQYSIFELLIPWSEVKPYHPWVQDNLVLNLCFVKADSKADKVFYFIKTDERMQSESSKRKFIHPKFMHPERKNISKLFLSRQNFLQNSDIDLIVTCFSNEYRESFLELSLISLEDKTRHRKEYKVFFDKGFNRKKLQLIKNNNLSPGCYQLEITKNSHLVMQSKITIIEELKFEDYISLLSKNTTKEKSGSYNTLKFYLLNLQERIKKLSPEDSALSLNEEISSLKEKIVSFAENNDPIKEKKGVYRRAFISKIDNNLRPYSIYIPDSYNENRPMPLLVYLHGSGEDDRALFRADFIKDGFIVLAPNGRGTSNCFATSEAITDVFESIEDVLNNFNIKKEKIILSGFSMGGYGVYRIYYEKPELFKAIAIKSGHPNLAEKWGFQELAVNFLKKENLSVFSHVPLFIYHGKKDLNCPFSLTEEFVNNLEKINKNITFIIDDEAGHGKMSESNKLIYYQWLQRNLD